MRSQLSESESREEEEEGLAQRVLRVTRPGAACKLLGEDEEDRCPPCEEDEANPVEQEQLGNPAGGVRPFFCAAAGCGERFLNKTALRKHIYCESTTCEPRRENGVAYQAQGLKHYAKCDL